jgi:hypothetical protein
MSTNIAALRLYRTILRLHRTRIPPQARGLGDKVRVVGSFFSSFLSGLFGFYPLARPASSSAPFSAGGTHIQKRSLFLQFCFVFSCLSRALEDSQFFFFFFFFLLFLFSKKLHSQYVKSEFHAHRSASESQVAAFMKEWVRYAAHLEASAPLPEIDEARLSLEQRAKLAEMRQSLAADSRK